MLELSEDLYSYVQIWWKLTAYLFWVTNQAKQYDQHS